VNPFDLRGPAFLGFYLVLALVVFILVHALRRQGEDGPVPRFQAVDPYLIAYLRGGTPEAVRAAVLSLIDRGFLRPSARSIGTTGEGLRAGVSRPLERALLEACRDGTIAHKLHQLPAVESAAAALEPELVRQGLMPDQSQLSRRFVIGLVALAILGGISLVRIVNALIRHRPFGFLLVLTLVAAAGVVALLGQRRTTLGSRVLADLQELFAGLRGRADELPSGGATNELALLLGVFGIGALVGERKAQAVQLFPAGNGSGASGSSSCGTSSCSSSSCGGGGCGGGCGGCGS
jgi:uncharacterized protein (TIGR04222 family)